MLNFELTVSTKRVNARLVGLVSIVAWTTVLKELEIALQDNAIPPHLLMDLTGLVGYLGVPERQEVGALMARHLARMQKVALVVQAYKITNVVQDEAQRNGLSLRLFSSQRDALAWISA